jgi:hypothetical protein
VVLLRATCRALRDTVREWPMDVGDLYWSQVRSALTCFPKAHTMTTYGHGPGNLSHEAGDSLLEWLRGRGASVRRLLNPCEAGWFLWRVLRGACCPTWRTPSST